MEYDKLMVTFAKELEKAGDDEKKQATVLKAYVSTLSIAHEIEHKEKRAEADKKTLNGKISNVVSILIALCFGIFALTGIAFAIRLLMQVLGFIH